MVLKNNKSLGQHWLKNRLILDDIAGLSEVEGISTCLEIGPGLGTLTSSLFKVFPKIIAVEYDQRLAQNLPKSFPGKDLTVINQDFLDFDLGSLERPYVAVGNIPYYITSPIIQRLLSADNSPAKIVLLIQKEVAERIAAGVGKHTVLSLTVQNLAKVTLGPVVTKEFFTPPPKVDSEIIILEPKKPEVDEEVLKLIKIGFSAPRKKLTHNLAAGTGVDKQTLRTILEHCNISPDSRPADLSLENWKKLAQNIHKR